MKRYTGNSFNRSPMPEPSPTKFQMEDVVKVVSPGILYDLEGEVSCILSDTGYQIYFKAKHLFLLLDSKQFKLVRRKDDEIPKG